MLIFCHRYRSKRRPDWLDEVHRTLDAAVLDAYGRPDDVTDEDILPGLLALNLERAAKQGRTPVQVVVDEV